MTSIPDFTHIERWTIQSACSERWYRDEVELQAADVEIRVAPEDPSLTECPAMFWLVDGCSFVVVKTDEMRYRCQFFYSDDMEQFGTGIREYDDLAHCVVALLRTQADHHSERSGAYPSGA